MSTSGIGRSPRLVVPDWRRLREAFAAWRQMMQTLIHKWVSYLRTLGEVLMRSETLELVRGTLDLLILKAMTWGPKHGLGIVRWIEQTTGDRLQIEEGALYPALHRLEKKGWLTSEWGYTERNREAKFYRLSPAGRRAFAAQVTTWRRYIKVVDLVLTREVA